MHRLVLFLLSLFLLICTALPAAAQTITVTTCEWAPYSGEALPGQGFTTEIVVAALERTGHTVEVTIQPWKRALETTARGDFMALYNGYYSDERAQDFIFSDPYVSGPIVLAAKAGSDISYATLDDLKPYTIGVSRGFVYTQAFDDADFLNKDVSNDDLSSLRKLLAGRIDLMVGDKFVIIDMLKNNPTLDASPADVTFLEPPLAENDVHILFPKVLPNARELADAFNEGLRMIREDGTYERILTKYGFQ